MIVEDEEDRMVAILLRNISLLVFSLECATTAEVGAAIGCCIFGPAFPCQQNDNNGRVIGSYRTKENVLHC
jgi:hypothetical protein